MNGLTSYNPALQQVSQSCNKSLEMTEKYLEDMKKVITDLEEIVSGPELAVIATPLTDGPGMVNGLQRQSELLGHLVGRMANLRDRLRS